MPVGSGNQIHLWQVGCIVLDVAGREAKRDSSLNPRGVFIGEVVGYKRAAYGHAREIRFRSIGIFIIKMAIIPTTPFPI